MLFFLVFINSAFAFLIALALILSDGGANVTSEILLNFLFYVIITPVIATTMQKVMFMSEGNMTVADAFDIIDSVLDRKPFENGGKSEKPDDHSVVFENASFSYDGENLALDDISFEVKSSTSLALVGPSGGGKTTAAGLIARFWDVQDGAVKIGGVNVKDIPKEVLMNTVSYVFQDSRLLKRSILENVRLSRPDATEQEVMCALEKAQCTDIIEKLPDGINTVIGVKGVYLSGGEQQRISIARAFLKGGTFALHDIFSKSKYGDMQAYVKRLKKLGYEKVELIDTTEKFMKKWEPVWMELSGSALLVGKK